MRATSTRRAMSARVFCTDCRAISGLPKVSVAGPLQRQVEAALGAGVGLHRQRRPFGDECLRDLRETRVLRSHQVSTGTRVDVGQFGGIGLRQPILSSLRVTLNPGVSVSTTSSDTPAAPGPPVRTAVTTKSAPHRR